MGRIADYNMVKHFDFEKLPGAYEVACYLNVGLGCRGVPARVIVLCGAPVYVQLPIGGNDVDSFRRDGEARIYFHGRMRY
jgi:hypothetical protein